MVSLYQSGKNFASAVQICLLKYDDLSTCDTLIKLKFKCDICKNPTVYKHDTYQRVFIQMQVGELRGHAVYRLDRLPHLAVRIQELHGTSLKFCAYKHTNLKGVVSPGNGSVKLPIRKCASDTDCKTGEHCFAFQMPFWSNPTAWKSAP